MELNIDNSRLLALIPNVIHTVTNETTLYDKLQPWLSSAKSWLESNILGSYQPEGPLALLAEKIVVYRAFADAAPSLDLLLSPAGFSVIDTEGRAPASKERVERLINALNSFVDANLAALLLELHKKKEWAASSEGSWFRDSFLPDFTHVPRFRGDRNLLQAYRIMREAAKHFEQLVAELYLGHEFLEYVRNTYPAFTDNGAREIYEMIQSAELKYISARLIDKKNMGPDSHFIWHLVRHIIAQLNYWPELKNRWSQEMSDTFNVEPFKNTVKGGFYF